MVEKNVQDALVSELSIPKEAWFAKHMPTPCKELCNARWITHSLSNSSGPFEMSVDPGHNVSCGAQGVGMTSLNVAERTRVYFLMELVSGGELLDALDALGLLKYSQAPCYWQCTAAHAHVSIDDSRPAESWRLCSTLVALFWHWSFCIRAAGFSGLEIAELSW